MEAMMVWYKVRNVAAPNKKDLNANTGSRSLKIPWLKPCVIGILLPVVSAFLFIEYYCCIHVEAIDTGHASPSGTAINLALGRLNLWTPRGALIKVCYRHRLNNRKRPNKANCTVAHLDCNWVGIRWDEVDRKALSLPEVADDCSCEQKKGREMMAEKCERPQVISSLIYLKKLLDPSFAGSAATECRIGFVLPLFASVPSKPKVCTSLMPTETDHLLKFH